MGLSLRNNTSTVQVFDRTRRFVYAKDRWDDEWRFVRYMEPVERTRVLAPDVAAARFRYRFGNIKPEDSTTFSQRNSYTDTLGRFIRITEQTPGQKETPVWIGVIDQDATEAERGDTQSGEQSLSARGPEYLLTKIFLFESVVETIDKDSNESYAYTGTPYTFNLNDDTSGLLLRGNRSYQYDLETNLPVFGAFRADPVKWNALDVVRYICGWFAPPGITIIVDGQTDALSDLESVWDLRNASVWEALNAVIDRRKGLAFWVSVDTQDRIHVTIGTVVDKPVSFGGRTLPGNPNVGFFALPTQYPYEHLVDAILFRETADQGYDNIYVRGAPIKACFSLETCKDASSTHAEDGNRGKGKDFAFMEAGWTTAQQTSYDTAAGDANPSANDEWRTRNRYLIEPVFREFTINDRWNGRDPWGLTCNWKTDDHGAITPPDTDFFHLNGTTIDRELPILRNTDYSVTALTTAGPDPGTPDFHEVLAFVNAFKIAEEQNAEYSLSWHDMGRLNASHRKLAFKDPVSYQSLNKAPGIRLNLPTPHQIDGRDFRTQPNNFSLKPRGLLDYRTIKWTIAMDTNHHVQLVARINDPPNGVPRNLEIREPDAELWLLNQNTTVGLKPDGTLALAVNKVGNKSPDRAFRGVILRDDRDSLRCALAFAKAWHGKPRNAVTIPIKSLGEWAPIGGILTDVRAAVYKKPIATIISAIITNYDTDTVAVSTDYGELDYTSFFRLNARRAAAKSGSKTPTRAEWMRAHGIKFGRNNPINFMPNQGLRLEPGNRPPANMDPRHIDFQPWGHKKP